MKALLFGGGGQLGSDLMSTRAEIAVAPDHRWCDVRDRDEVHRWLSGERPEVVINAAAFHDLAACEENLDEALDVNVLGAYNVAVEAAAIGARVVYISTDYVFDGLAGNYVEDDPTWPCNVYGASKAAGEMVVREANPDSLIVRTQALYGRTPPSGKPGGNFPTRILWKARHRQPINVVDDQFTCPTWTRDVAFRVWELVERAHPGVYHVANAGAASWHAFAVEICRIAGIDADIRPVKTAPDGVPRPQATILTDTKMALAGFAPMRGWREALAEYLG